MSNVKNYSEPGGEKWVVGGEIEIAAGGKLTFQGAELKPATVQADSVASTVAGAVADLNALIAKLKAAGLMASE
ncbi:MAG: Head fiber protein [Bacteroidales bacterium]